MTYKITEGRIMTLTQQWRYLKFSLLETAFKSYFLRKEYRWL